MAKKTIYLCGAIAGKSDAECNDWRSDAKKLLGDDYNTLDPMRRDYRGIERDHTKDIVWGDIQDIAVSDALLVRAETPSWGTAMEVVYGYMLGKRIVAWGTKGRPSPWLMYHTHGTVAPTLTEAISWLKMNV